MRFRIEVTADAQGWDAVITSPDDPAWPPIHRPIGKGDRGYPRPPAGEADWWSAEAPAIYQGNDDSALRRVHERCVRGQPDKTCNEVTSFGRYLFAVLLGTAWQAIQLKAPAGGVELELQLAQSGGLFERLPWEMMFCTDGPLIGLNVKGRRIAISRIAGNNVHTAVGAATTPKEIKIPLRVLFVVGRQMDDKLRPGAEYLGLLRQCEVQLPVTGGTSIGVALHTKLLLSATRAELIDAVKEFEPSVVHLICHGRWNGESAEILLTKSDDASEDPVTSTALLGLLGAPDPKVPVVVLNACNTAQASDVQISYAAALVAGGIPVVVGMAGEVADSVCRMFTLSFYRALFEHQPLPLAVAEGRRAALLQYRSYTDNVEWARPVLYMADGFQAGFTLDRTGRQVALSAKFLRKRKDDILCDRMDYLHDLEQVCSRKIGNLGLTVDERAPVSQGITAIQLGKTWLLEEMRWLAVLEGYVPCFLESTGGADPPSTYLEFALQLAESMNKARASWDAPVRWRTAAIAAVYAEVQCQMPNDDDTLSLDYGRTRKLFVDSKMSSLTPDAVNLRILRDLRDLLNEAKLQLGARGVLILIDDLHKHEGVWHDILESVNRFGLGDINTPAPVIFSYSSCEKAGPQIVTYFQQNSSRFELRPLNRFRPEERILAYRQSLLSRKWVPTSKPDRQEDVQKMFGGFERLAQGIPSYLRLSKLEGQLEYCAEIDVLLSSDDGAILAAARRLDGLP